MKTTTSRYIRLTLYLTLLVLLVLGIRNYIVGDSVFNFLKSNLFIGSFPTLVIAYLIERNYEKLHTVVFWFGTLLWVLFYPNCPYMITDLIHNTTDIPNSELIKYDTLIIFCIAMISVFYGFLSIKIMFTLFNKRHGIKFAKSAILITLILSCLGFYIGREVLSAKDILNGYTYSWEVFLEPLSIIKNTWQALWPIGEHLSAYYLMALFGIAQIILLVLFKEIGNIESNFESTKD